MPRYGIAPFGLHTPTHIRSSVNVAEPAESRVASAQIASISESISTFFCLKQHWSPMWKPMPPKMLSSMRASDPMKPPPFQPPRSSSWYSSWGACTTHHEISSVQISRSCALCDSVHSLADQWAQQLAV